MSFIINKEKCLGCGACALICLFNIPSPLDADKAKYAIDAEKCLGCGQCESICPNNAIFASPDHKKIKRVYINPENCIGCSLCARACPANAPSGTIKQPFVIDEDKCILCGLCASKCRKDAIIVEYDPE